MCNQGDIPVLTLNARSRSIVAHRNPGDVYQNGIAGDGRPQVFQLKPSRVVGAAAAPLREASRQVRFLLLQQLDLTLLLGGISGGGMNERCNLLPNVSKVVADRPQFRVEGVSQQECPLRHRFVQAGFAIQQPLSRPFGEYRIATGRDRERQGVLQGLVDGPDITELLRFWQV